MAGPRRPSTLFFWKRRRRPRAEEEQVPEQERVISIKDLQAVLAAKEGVEACE